MEARSFSRGALSGHILGCHGHVPLQFLDLERWQVNPCSPHESLDVGAELGSRRGIILREEGEAGGVRREEEKE